MDFSQLSSYKQERMQPIPADLAERVVSRGTWWQVDKNYNQCREPLAVDEGATVASLAAPYKQNGGVWLERTDSADKIIIGCCHAYGSWQMILELAPLAPVEAQT